MPGWLSYVSANELLNWLYRGVVPTIPGTLYLRLLVSPSNRAGGGTETNYSGYARLAMQRDTGSLFTVSPTSGRLTNSILIEFPKANSLGNGDLVAFDVVDTPSGAFTKTYNGGPILPARSIVVGKEPKFKADSLEFTF